MIVIFDVLILIFYIFNSVKKIRKKKIMMTWPLICLNKNITTINVMFQFLNILIVDPRVARNNIIVLVRLNCKVHP